MIQKELSEIRASIAIKRGREAFWKKITWLVFASSTATFFILEPVFLYPLAGLAITVILFFIVSFSISSRDTSEPDGGHNKAIGQGCFYSILMFIALAWSGLAFLTAIPSSNNFVNVVLYLISLSVCSYLYLNIHNWLFPDSDRSGRSLNGCWVCEIEAHIENSYTCPFCGFVSKDKKRHGLARHLSNKHADQLDGIPSFHAVCETCSTRDT